MLPLTTPNSAPIACRIRPEGQLVGGWAVIPCRESHPNPLLTVPCGTAKVGWPLARGGFPPDQRPDPWRGPNHGGGSGSAAPPPPLWTLILGPPPWPFLTPLAGGQKLPFWGPCGAESGGGGGAPPTTLILLRNQRRARLGTTAPPPRGSGRWHGRPEAPTPRPIRHPPAPGPRSPPFGPVRPVAPAFACWVG